MLVDTAYTMAAIIEGKNRVQWDDNNSNIREEMMYYITDGMYGSFRWTHMANRVSDPIPLDTHKPNETLYKTTIWGPTCDCNDAARKDVMLPELNIGDWIYFKTMGAYTMSTGTEFNGFKVPRQLFYVTNKARRFIDNMSNRDKIMAVLETGLIQGIPVFTGPSVNGTVPANVINFNKPKVESTIEDVMRYVIAVNSSTGSLDEPFYVLDVEDIIEKHRKLVECIPRVQHYYAVKCNPSPLVLQLLAGLGVGFDCASKGEIDMILNIGVPPNRIIYANPCKPGSYILYAANKGVTRMTFDTEHELYKVRQLHPGAEMVVHIHVDEHYSKCPLGTKFGAPLRRVRHLLEVAKQLGVNVIGCSFHVGSGCQSGEAYTKSIADARLVFDIGQNLGFDMRLLDIGIVDSAFTLATTIIGKKCVEWEDSRPPEMMYYLNDGLYGSFTCTRLDHVVTEPIPLDMGFNTPIANRPIYITTLWGPTCDSHDWVKKDVIFPDMHIGEWVYFKNMGAYTLSTSTEFNGFKVPRLLYHLSGRARHMLRLLPNMAKVMEIMGTDTISTISTLNSMAVDKT
ncbi:unnamed protein product [Oppiella nova]|uniref:ornithine decarboxylase n=1 Tax=Oppiella nova TaxID=334625 RepID=A0A7R9QS46_9ACAR|nr:unnamed protein product [Oppiella nova]CAG2172313.1 unnamed protein product [Oppiella nova]